MTVVGGGISGLAAAVRLTEAGADVELIEGSERLGGKLRTVGGLESGAEAFLMRDPAGGPSAVVQLAQSLDLEIVHPEPVGAGLYVGGELKRLPAGTLLGIPGPHADVAGIAAITPSDVDNGKPVLENDVSVGELVRPRLGDQVVDRLVDPLLGGVYAGRADRLSVAATMPALYELLKTEHTLTEAVRKAQAKSRAHAGGPIFGTILGGMSRLVEAAAARLKEVRTKNFVKKLPQGPVILAIPAPKAARLLPGLGLERLEYASVALVTLEFPETELPDLSGFLVPEDQGLTIKAATFFGKKWQHIDGAAVRTSLGRAGDTGVLQASDDDLIRIALADLSKVVGPLPRPLAARVARWGGCLPQYPPGHVEHVAAVRRAVPERVALAGAAYDGVGIPICVKSGIQAADLILQRWGA